MTFIKHILLIGLLLTNVIADNFDLAIDLAKSSRVDKMVKQEVNTFNYIKGYVYNTADITPTKNSINTYYSLTSQYWEAYDISKEYSFVFNDKSIYIYDIVTLNSPEDIQILYKANPNRTLDYIVTSDTNIQVLLPHDNTMKSFVNNVILANNNNMIDVQNIAPTDINHVWYDPDGSGGFEVKIWDNIKNIWVSKGNFSDEDVTLMFSESDNFDPNSFPGIEGQKAMVEENNNIVDYLYSNNRWIPLADTNSNSLFNGYATLLETATTIFNSFVGSEVFVTDFNRPYTWFGNPNPIFRPNYHFTKITSINEQYSYWISGDKDYIIANSLDSVKAQDIVKKAIFFENGQLKEVWKDSDNKWKYIATDWNNLVSNFDYINSSYEVYLPKYDAYTLKHDNASNYTYWSSKVTTAFPYQYYLTGDSGRTIFPSPTNTSHVYLILNNDCTVTTCYGPASNSYYSGLNAGISTDGMYRYYVSNTGKRLNSLTDDACGMVKPKYALGSVNGSYTQCQDKITTAEHCPSGTTYNTTSNKCEQGATCPTGFSYKSSRDKCERTIQCSSTGYGYNTGSNYCEDNYSCLTGTGLQTTRDKCEVNPTCVSGYNYINSVNRCERAPTCIAGTSYNTTTNRCETSWDCPTGSTWDAGIQRCKKALNCTSGFTYNTSSNKCEKAPSCTSGFTYNTSSNKCEKAPSCTSGFTYNTSSNKCEKNATYHSSYYYCNSGWTLYNTNKCYKNVNANLSSAYWTCPTSSNNPTITSGTCQHTPLCNSYPSTTYNNSTNKCEMQLTCNSGYTYNSGTDLCEKSTATLIGARPYTTRGDRFYCNSSGYLIDTGNENYDHCTQSQVNSALNAINYEISGNSYTQLNCLDKYASVCCFKSDGHTWGHHASRYDTTKCPLYNYATVTHTVSCPTSNYTRVGLKCSVSPKCDTNYNLNTSSDKCEATGTYHDSYYYCNSGWTLHNTNKCYKINYANYQNSWYTCSSGNLSGSKCQKNSTCSSSSSLNTTTDKCQKNSTCSSSSNLNTITDKCQKNSTCIAGTSLNTSRDQCETTHGCPTGTSNYNGTICIKNSTCNTSGILDTDRDRCYKNYSCLTGTSLNTSIDKCQTNPTCLTGGLYNKTRNLCTYTPSNSDCSYLGTPNKGTVDKCQQIPSCPVGTIRTAMDCKENPNCPTVNGYSTYFKNNGSNDYCYMNTF